MTTGYLSLTHLINAKITADRAELDSSRIKDLIGSDFQGPVKARMNEGVNYYNARHDVLNHKNFYFLDGVQTEDLTKANARVSHPFHRVLVDQKVAYVVGNPVVISVAEPDIEEPEAPTEKELAAQESADEFQEAVLDLVSDGFDDLLTDWSTGAANKGVEWVHFYYDAEGEFRYTIVPAEQVIAVYDTQYQKELLYVIRYYVYDLIDEKGVLHQRFKVEWWSKDNVEYFQEQINGTYVHDPFYEVNPGPHWFSFNTRRPEDKATHGWGRVPFVRLDNNSDSKSDLEPIKSLIDAYDDVKSGWVNDLKDFQELVYVLKGYSSLSDEAKTGLSELAMFMKNLKTHKVISVTAEGGVETLKAEIPVEAKTRFLDITRKEIFFFGQGVDVDTEKISNPSGVALKFLYTSLDLKANRLIRKFKKALGEFFWFVVEHINREENSDFDSTDLLFTFNKSVIFNEKEKIDGLVASEGILSKKTILENHPYVDDAEEEEARLEAEKQDSQNSDLVNLDSINPDGSPMLGPDGLPVVPPPPPAGGGEDGSGEVDPAGGAPTTGKGQAPGKKKNGLRLNTTTTNTTA